MARLYELPVTSPELLGSFRRYFRDNRSLRQKFGTGDAMDSRFVIAMLALLTSAGAVIMIFGSFWPLPSHVAPEMVLRDVRRLSSASSLIPSGVHPEVVAKTRC